MGRHPHAVSVRDDPCETAVGKHSNGELVGAKLGVSIQRPRVEPVSFTFCEPDEIGRPIEFPAKIQLFGRVLGEVPDTSELVAGCGPCGPNQFVADRCDKSSRVVGSYMSVGVYTMIHPRMSSSR